MLSSDATDAIGLAEFVTHLERDIKLVDVDGLAAAAPAFKRLLNNRRLLTDFIDDELRNWRTGRTDHQYVGNTVTLVRRPHFLIRANLWEVPDPRRRPPRPEDPNYNYLQPHDHNFAFLTGGYHGSGYSTVLFDYEHDSVAGIPGERVELRALGRSTLPRGAMTLYYPSRDVHYQELPTDLSISINVVVPDPYTERSQFFFDVAEHRIVVALAPASARGTTLCDLAAEVGDENTADLLNDVVKRAEDPRVRLAAARALGALHPADGGPPSTPLRFHGAALG
jgi:hypothetical protein